MGQTVADRIRKIRVTRGLTQENVAEDLGITHGAYAKIERGETDPNTARLHDIAKALGVNVTEFFEDISLAKENKNAYGYATKDDVESLTRLVQSLAKEIEKLRDEMSRKKRSPKKKS